MLLRRTLALRYDAQRRVRAILFTYPLNYDWAKEVRDYATALGRPVLLREDLQRPSAEWHDATTTFRVWCEPSPRMRRCHAALRDRVTAR